MDFVTALAVDIPKSETQSTDTAISEDNFLELVFRVISISAVSYIGFSYISNC